MGQLTSVDILNQIDTIRNNPAAMQRIMLQNVEYINDGGIIIVDATNPFVMLSESACVLSSAAIGESDVNTQKQYPSAAITMEDLYLHMSDQDYLDRFSSPSSTTITLLLSLDHVKQAALPITSTVDNATTSTLRKLTVPRHTEIKVANMAFTMQYPIDILVLPTGGINIVYDVSRPSPIYLIENNQLNWEILSVQGTNYLAIDIPMKQMQIQSNTAQMNAISGFSKVYTFTDNFYYCRVFNKNNNSSDWVEVLTTHTEQVYDQRKVTAVLKVIDQTLTVQIPQIYFNNDSNVYPNGHVRDTLRIDIYTTKGIIETTLANYDPSSFSARWVDKDEEFGGKFSAALNAFPALAIYSTNPVTGGSGPKTFDELRDQVVNRSFQTEEKPITEGQLSTVLSDMGYQLVTNIDNVTNRQLLATRIVPAPADGSTITGIGTAIKTFQSKMVTLAAMDTGASSPIVDPVSNNSIRLTIKPTMLYRENGGVITPVQVSQIDTWKAMTPDNRVAAINAESLLYSPFYYVLDTTDNQFETRAYRLDKPSIPGKFFKQGHETSGTVTATKAQTILLEPTGKGYRLIVEIVADEAVKSLIWEAPPGPGLPGYQKPYLQLSYVPPGSATRVFFNGTLVSRLTTSAPYRPVNDRYLYAFELDTSFDIDNKHRIVFDASGANAALTTTFDLTISFSNYRSDVPKNDIQLIIDPLQYPVEVSDYLGVAWEKITIKFGEHLSGLWTRSRSVLDSVVYQTYSDDVYSSYSKTIYEADINGNVVLTYNSEDDELVYNVLHWPGEPVLNTAGQDALADWLIANPTSTSNIFDWIATLSLGDRVSYITNLENIYVGPNSTDTPILTGPGQTAYDDWLVLNPTSPSDIFDWWATLDLTTQKTYWEILHEKDAVVIGVDGEPVIQDGNRGIVRQFDMLFFDGKYYFADNEATVNYVEETVDLITYWCTVDIPSLEKRLLERTTIDFYPIATIGFVNGIVGQNDRVTLQSNQDLSFSYQLTDDAYNNDTLKESIQETTGKIIAVELGNKTVSMSSLITKLKAIVGDPVIDVKIDGFLNDLYPAITLTDNSMRLTVGKRLVALSNKTIIVEDALTFSFINHS